MHSLNTERCISWINLPLFLFVVNMVYSAFAIFIVLCHKSFLEHKIKSSSVNELPFKRSFPSLSNKRNNSAFRILQKSK